MRESNRKVATQKRAAMRRACRRAAILGVILASTPVIADDNQKTSIRFNTDVPTKTEPIKNNPFVAPPKVAETPVQLASSKEASIIRLKPIGKVIGLTPIDAPNQARASLEIEESIGSIQANPLAAKSRSPKLTNVVVENPSSRFAGDSHVEFDRSSNAGAAESVTIGLPPRQTAKAIPVPMERIQLPLTDVPVVGSVPVPAPPHLVSPSSPAPASVAAPAPPNASPVGITLVKPKANVAVRPVVDEHEGRALPAESNPVFFSLSDDSRVEGDAKLGADSGDSRALTTVTDAGDVVVPAPVTGVEIEPHDVGHGPTVDLAPAPRFDEAAPVVVGPVEMTIDPQESTIPAALPAPVGEPKPLGEIVAANAVPLATEKTSIPDAAVTSQQRYRPPVAVVAPPLLIAREASKNLVQEVENQVLPPPVKTLIPSPAQAPLAKTSQGVTGTEPKTVTLQMTKAQVRSLTLGGEVRKVTVSDQEVCQAFASGPNQLKLIGVGNGVTQLVVWASQDGTGRVLKRAFEVRVDEAIEAKGLNVDKKVSVLNQSIADTFPNSRIVVRRLKDHLVVSGSCQDDSVAKKIIRMVRKTCLIPVRDEIVIR